MYQNVLVTGVTGRVGTPLARALQARGVSVIGQGRNKETLLPLSNEGITPLHLDLRKQIDNLPFLPRIEAVVHCSEERRGSYKHLNIANVLSTQNALAIANAAGARRFVLLSSSRIYNQNRDQLDLREDTPLRKPTTYYARSKLAAETEVRSNRSVHSVILRAPTVYGSEAGGLFPQFVRAAKAGPMPLVRDGVAARSVIHIADLINAVCAALDVKTIHPGTVINVASGEPVLVTDIVEKASLAADWDVHWRRSSVRSLFRRARLGELAAQFSFSRKVPLITHHMAGMLAFQQTLDIRAGEDHLQWSPSIKFDEGSSGIFA